MRNVVYILSSVNWIPPVVQGIVCKLYLMTPYNLMSQHNLMMSNIPVLCNIIMPCYRIQSQISWLHRSDEGGHLLLLHKRPGHRKHYAEDQHASWSTCRSPCTWTLRCVGSSCPPRAPRHIGPSSPPYSAELCCFKLYHILSMLLKGAAKDTKSRKPADQFHFLVVVQGTLR